MPELPEVETTRCGIAPYLVGRRISEVTIRQPRLRWRVPNLKLILSGQIITAVHRRAKYLLFEVSTGTLIIHLGMSGSLRVVARHVPPAIHDHVDIIIEDTYALRLRDPRRFGAVLWTPDDPHRHPLLASLGPEPLSADFTGDGLYQRARPRKIAIKHLIMDSRVVVGVGNIYANETLHLAGIHPARAANRIAQPRYARLAESIKVILTRAIAAGGTTLRDFVREDGQPGYFRAALAVYDRAGAPCVRCGEPVRRSVMGQRATFYCLRCQR